jgi:cytochrome c-type biogenesis protein CcmE
MRDGFFECTKLQMKCPSKYKDDLKAAEKTLPTAQEGESSKRLYESSSSPSIQ